LPHPTSIPGRIRSIMGLLIHHLHVSQSERLPWLCEELGVAYELKTYRRAPILAPPEYKALHPAGTAPVIQDGDITLAESGACIEYIAHRHGGGRLFLPPTHKEYADFLYWWHWPNATFQPSLGRAMAARVAGIPADSMPAKLAHDRLNAGLQMLETRLAKNEWLAGSEFTVADVMVVFSLTTFRYFFSFSLREYSNVLRYLERVGQRGAYQRAMSRCDPDMVLVLGAEGPEKTVL